MANNKNKTKAVIVCMMLSPLFAHHASADTITEDGKDFNKSTSVSFLAGAALSYLPKSFPVLTSMARMTAQFASAVKADAANYAAPSEALIQPRTEAEQPTVIQAAIKPGSLPAKTAAPASTAAFDTVAIPFKRLSALKRLAPSIEQIQNGTAISCRGGKCNPATTAVKLVSADGSQGSIRDKLNAVNAAVNTAIRYKTDQETNGVADYWSTPSETLARQQGDCEDFAILKMAALQADGVDPSLMSIVVLFDQKRHFYHAVLSVEIAGRHFILDNMRNQVLQDTQLPDYLPLYSIRDGKGYLHGSQRQKQVASATIPLEKIAPGEGVSF